MERDSMEFGIFDHLDHTGMDLRTQYAQRLELAALYDELGFYAYHLAEHHSTPLGMSPSPSVFLSAVIQRTRPTAHRAAGLSAPALSPAASHRRGLHAGQFERRPHAGRRRTRNLADRAGLLRKEAG